MKTSLVIGGTKGIGKEITKRLEKRGDKVFVVSRSENNKKNHIQLDITDDDLSILLKKIKKLNYLVFAQRYRGENEDSHYDVSVKATDKIIKALKNRFCKEASVILIGSVSTSHIIIEQSSSYHASRSALESLMKYYAVEYGKYQIRFNCVSPDVLIKDENKKFLKKNHPLVKSTIKSTPLKKIGKSRDLSNLIEFLCSEKSSFVTGQTILVDGGLSLVGQRSINKL